MFDYFSPAEDPEFNDRSSKLEYGVAGMFEGCQSLTSVSGMNHWNTAEVECFDRVFHNCGVKNVDIRSWRFDNCESIQQFMEIDDQESVPLETLIIRAGCIDESTRTVGGNTLSICNDKTILYTIHPTDAIESFKDMDDNEINWETVSDDTPVKVTFESA